MLGSRSEHHRNGVRQACSSSNADECHNDDTRGHQFKHRWHSTKRSGDGWG